jgi:hypothetical protein
MLHIFVLGQSDELLGSSVFLRVMAVFVHDPTGDTSVQRWS